MAPSQPPSLGRIVHVPMNPDENNGADVAPAVVTRVWSDTMINVTVFPDAGMPFPRTSVDYRKQLEAGHFWTWPPRVG